MLYESLLQCQFDVISQVREILRMKAQLENIYNSAKADIEQAQSISDVDEIKLKYLSRKGEFNSIKKGLKDLSDEEKRTVGALANQITQQMKNIIVIIKTLEIIFIKQPILRVIPSNSHNPFIF